jgi:hypothetical protein
LGPTTHRGLCARGPHRRVVTETRMGHAIDTGSKDLSFRLSG